MNNQDLSLLLKALAFAAEKHRNQRRKDAASSPYINHPIALANVLVNEGGITDVNVICGALLHDTIEDTDTRYEELVDQFGELIASIVLEVSDDTTLPRKERKQMQIDRAPYKSNEAKLVKLADKISNLRDVIGSPPASWSTERKTEYFQWAFDVIDGVRGTSPALEAVFDRLYEDGIKRLSVGTE
ncbi:MAG: HD domain-containing protein [Gammaproteobacteria bacterium]